MPTDQTCDHGQIRACMLRIAQLAADGSTPSTGLMYVTEAMIELTLTPEVQDGDSLQARNGCGDFLVDFKDDDRVRWWNLSMKLGEPNAGIASLLMPGFTALTAAGDTIGGKFPALGKLAPSNGVSLEVWAIRLGTDGQTKDGTNGYYKWGLPLTRGWRPAVRALSNTALENEFLGRAFTNGGWGNGPANDWGTIDTTASPLIYVQTNTIPTDACGTQPIPAQV